MKVFLLGSLDISLLSFRGPLIRDMIAQGHEVVAAAPPDHAHVPVRLREWGAAYVAIPFRRTGMNPFEDLLTLFRIRRVLQQHRPDLFLGYTIKPVLYGSMAARMAGVPHIASMVTGLGYTFRAAGLKGRLVGRVARCLYRKAMRYNDCVFFHNPDDLDTFVSLGFITQQQGERTNGSGVDLEYYRKTPLPRKRTTFLLVARLLRDKGIGEFAEAARRIKQRFPDAEFHLVGPLDPNPMGITETEITGWQRDGILEYHGYQQNIRPFMECCSVYVLPSYYPEGMPRSLLEAMAMGRPVVTADSVGCREAVRLTENGRQQRADGAAVMEGENGFLVKPRESESLEQALVQLLEDPGQLDSMAETGRQMAEQMFDVHAVNRRIMERLSL